MIRASVGRRNEFSRNRGSGRADPVKRCSNYSWRSRNFLQFWGSHPILPVLSTASAGTQRHPPPRNQRRSNVFAGDPRAGDRTQVVAALRFYPKSEMVSRCCDPHPERNPTAHAARPALEPILLRRSDNLPRSELGAEPSEPEVLGAAQRTVRVEPAQTPAELRRVAHRLRRADGRVSLFDIDWPVVEDPADSRRFGNDLERVARALRSLRDRRLEFFCKIGHDQTTNLSGGVFPRFHRTKSPGEPHVDRTASRPRELGDRSRRLLVPVRPQARPRSRCGRRVGSGRPARGSEREGLISGPLHRTELVDGDFEKESRRSAPFRSPPARSARALAGQVDRGAIHPIRTVEIEAGRMVDGRSGSIVDPGRISGRTHRLSRQATGANAECLRAPPCRRTRGRDGLRCHRGIGNEFVGHFTPCPVAALAVPHGDLVRNGLMILASGSRT